LVKHKRQGTWLPVGGELDACETPLEAARRELLEETGLTGSFLALSGVEGTPPGLLGYEEHVAGSKGLHLNFSFVAEVATDQVRANEQFAEHRWVADPSLVECPRNVLELGRMALHGGTPLLALARAWLAALNRRDAEALVHLYADDGLHTSPWVRAWRPHTLGEVRGHDALRSWWSEVLARYPALHYQEKHVAADRERVFLECMRTVGAAEEPYLIAMVLVCRGSHLVGSSHLYQG
jgi:ADP-ribose pyrophosphatase YjhB (NUDIX family)